MEEIKKRLIELGFNEYQTQSFVKEYRPFDCYALVRNDESIHVYIIKHGERWQPTLNKNSDTDWIEKFDSLFN